MKNNLKYPENYQEGRKFCPVCGSPVVDTARFCRFCGADMNAETEISDVYAGPEFYEQNIKAEDIPDEPMAVLYAGPDFFKKNSAVKDNPDEPISGVYAGPEMMFGVSDAKEPAMKVLYGAPRKLFSKGRKTK